MYKKAAKPSYLQFFTTSAGRKIVTFCAGTTAVGLFAGNYFPHTFLLDNYRSFVQCYKDGLVRPVPDVIQQRYEKALDILQVPDLERRFLKVFTVYGFDLFSAGSTKSKFGGLVGIPVNYSYNHVDEVNRSEIRFRNQEIKWRSDTGQKLLNSLVLKEDEQIFGICRTIEQLRTNRVLLNSCFPVVSFVLVYSIGNYLNQRLKLLTRPLQVRLVMYGILGLFGVGSWSFFKDFNQISYDTSIDKTLCELGPEFIDAGARFYDKLLQKNIALRELMGDDTYTAKGNENYFLRQKRLPLTVHKAYFESRLKELKGEEGATTVAS